MHFLFVTSWAITWMVEYAVWLCWERQRRLRSLVLCILVNSLTQPVAVHAYHRWLLGMSDYRGGHVAVPLMVIEVGVVLVEWVLIRYLLSGGWMRALGVSLTANTVTALVGLLF